MSMKNIENIDELFSKGLEEYKITPSPEVKKKVFSSPEAIKPNKPWYINNVFYFAVSFIALSSLLIYLGFFYHNDANKTSSSTIKNTNNVAILNHSKTVSAINNVNKNEEQKTQHPQSKNQEVQPENQGSNNLSEIKPLKNRVPELTENNVHPTKQIQKPAHPETIEITENPIRENDTVTQPSTGNKIPATETNSNKNISTSETETKTSANNGALTENRIETKENAEIYAVAQKTSLSIPEAQTILLFMDRKMFLLPTQPIFENVNLKPESSSYYQKGLWYAEVVSGVFMSHYKVTMDNDEWKPARDAKQQMLKPSLGYEAGVNVVYQQKRWAFKGGLNYANYSEKLSGNILLSNPHQASLITYNGGYYETIINGIYYDIDSTSYEHYTYTQTDHIYATDSTLAWNTHNRPVDVTDTTHVTRFDTLPKTVFYNRISYVEMPLSVGYAFPQGRFSFIVSASVIPGYFVSVYGLQMNTGNYPALEPYLKNTIKKFTLSAGLGVEINYRLNETWIFGVEPFYKKSLWGIYSNEYKINQHVAGYGFRMSIKKLL